MIYIILEVSRALVIEIRCRKKRTGRKIDKERERERDRERQRETERDTERDR